MNFLAKLLAILTQHNREQIRHGRDFEWSQELWIHNVFRVYEVIFGRRAGIRPSIAASKDGQMAFDLEGQLALYEVFVRSLFKKLKPRLVIIPQPQLALIGARMDFTPYRFAIAFDTAVAAGSPPKTATFTYSHTVTGSNPTIIAGGGMNAASTTSPTAQYNGSAMTAGTAPLQNTTSWGCIFYTANPPTGAHNVEFDDSVSTEWAVNSVSLTGTTASPSSPGGNSAKATSTSPSVSVTTTVANSWVVTACWAVVATFGTTTTGTNQTSRSTSQDLDSGFSAGISTQTTTSTGSYTSGWTISSALWIITAVEIQPAAASIAKPITSDIVFFN